jgi:uncharacterized protein DUF4345
MTGGYISSVVLAASGLAGILIPDQIAPVLDTVFASARGRSEFRIVYGALAALGGWAVAIADHELFVAIGVFWLGAAAVRLIALAVDHPRTGSTYWAFLALEMVLGLLGVLGSG